jgi:hypothetical protein
MASKKQLVQSEILAQTTIAQPASGFVSFGSKTTGLYQRLGAGADEKLLTEADNLAPSILTKIKTVDGAGSGLDADLLDGAEGALYARLISPTFTGTPTAPTAAVDANTTQLATTAFVRAQLSADASILVNQTAHGFAVGNAVGIVGSTWVKAKADSPANAVTLGLVSQVVDANNFRYVKGGVLAGTYTAGANYFLSTSVAGDLMILSEPEVWTDGQVRQYIGTGTKNGDGLDVEIDIGDVVGIGLAPDKYVSAISFDATYRILSLTRTGGLPALSVILPYPASDIAFEARDVTKGIAQTYVLDMKASWPYRILSIVTESDGTLTGVSVKINSTAVSGLGSLSIGTKAEINATSANSVATGDVVTINTAATYSDNPTLIRVKLKIQRV